MKSIYYCEKEIIFTAWHEKLIKLLLQLYKYINTYVCKFRKQMEQQNRT
jgi:hypothetical protein